MKLFSIFFIIFQFCNCLTNTSYNEVFSNIIHLLSTHMNLRELIEKFFEDENKECVNFVKEHLYKGGLKTKYKIGTLLEGIIKTGIAEHTIGMEIDCLSQKNSSYFFLLMEDPKISEEYKNSKNYDYGYNFRDFIEDRMYSKELCLNSQCYRVINTFFNKSINSIFYQKFPELFGFETLEIYNSYSSSSEREKYIKNQNANFEILKEIFVFYFYVRVFFSVMYIILNQEDNESNLDDIELIEKESNNSLTTNANIQQSFFYQFSQNLSLLENISFLFKKKNFIYDETEIISLNFILLIVLLLIMISQNSFFIMSDKRIGTTLSTFLNSKLFCITKLGTFAFESYKILSGIFLGYKLMSYLKRFYNKKKSLIIFFLYSIPYFVTFLSIIFFIEFHTQDIGNMISPSIRFNYKMDNFFNKNKCFKDKYYIFNPLFILGYFDLKYGYNTSCSRIALYSITQFYAFLYLILLLYLLFQIKNKKVDLIVFILNIASISLFYLFSKERKFLKDGKDFTISKIMGSTENISFLPFFFPLYYIGFNIGVILFYKKNCNILIYEKDSSYIPLSYNIIIMEYIDSVSQKIKNLIMFLCILFIIIISFVYQYNRGEQYKLTIKCNFILRFFYVYESIFSGFFFSIFLCFYLFSKQNSLISSILKSDFFIIISRISFICFNLFNFVPNVFFGINIIQVFVNHRNVIFVSISLLAVIILLSIIISIMILIPVRILIKCILKRNTEVKNRFHF